MLVGLINSKGQSVPFDKINEDTYKRVDWRIPPDYTGGCLVSWPLPFLRAISENNRQPGKLHVSDLLQADLRQVLKEREPYCTEPHNMIFIADGRALHSWLAEHGGIPAENRYDITVKLGEGFMESEAIVTGAMDYARHDGILQDYKRMNVYGAKKCYENGLETERPEYPKQLRWYGYILEQNGIVPRRPYSLFIWISNWQKRYRAKEQDPRFLEFPVEPTGMEAQEIQAAVEKRLRAQLSPAEDLEPCEDRGAFGTDKKTGAPNRCANYCEVNRFCPWFQASGWTHP